MSSENSDSGNHDKQCTSASCELALPPDSPKCEFTPCPQERSCFYYCGEHHETICKRSAFTSMPAALSYKPEPVAERTVESDSRNTPWPVCPITRRPFFMYLDHDEMGEVPTFGGPFDSYTIPEADDDGELRCERYDHDAGDWIEGGEPTGLWLVRKQPEFPPVAQTVPDRHAFDPIGNGVDECECGLTQSASIHLSDDVVDDQFVPFVADRAGEGVRDDHIWLRRTHEENGWAFGYFSDKPQDDAFIEYARVSPITAVSGDLEAQAREIAQQIVIDASRTAGYPDSIWLEGLFKYHLTEGITSALAAFALSVQEKTERRVLDDLSRNPS